MPLRPLSPLAALVLCALALPLGARANEGPRAGLEADLPARLQVQSCPTAAEVHLDDAAAAVRAAWLPARPSQRADVAGVTLTDDPRVLAHLRRVLGETPPRDWQEKARRCTSAICALRATLDGSWEAALWILAVGADGGPVASLDQAPFKGAGESTWAAGEVRTVARALLDLPAPLRQRASKLSAIRRIPDGQDPIHGSNALSVRPGGTGGGAILLRDSVWRMPLRGQRELLVHELGHHLEYALGGAYPISHSKQWLSFSNWHLAGESPDAKDAWKIDPRATVTSTAGPIPSEEFPDALADFRYNPRMLRAYSEPRYQFIKKLYGGADYLKPRSNPALDEALGRAGGILGAFRECGALVQRASRRPGQPQAQLYTVHFKKGGGSEFASWHRSFFVTRSPCVGEALERLRSQPAFKEAVCRQDDEQLLLDLSARLEDVWGAYAEAAGELEGAVPPQQGAACLQRGEVTLDCHGGATGRAVAEQQAKKIFAEFQPGLNPSQEEVDGLARQLRAQAVLAPPDEELIERFPALGSPPDFLGACLLGAVEVSTAAGKTEWRYWVRVPPGKEVRGFGSPVWTPACHRDFASYLKEKGVLAEPGDALFEHFAYLLKNQSAPLIERFNGAVLQQWPALRAACGIAAGTKATPEQQPCAAGWLEPRLAGLVAPALVPDLAKRLAARLRGP